MSNSEEALKLWAALKPMIDREIEAKTRSCIRAKKMLVTTAPDGSVIGVSEPWGQEILIPYSTSLSAAAVGDTVWVWMYYSSATNAIAMAKGDGQIPFSYVQTVNVTGSSPVIAAEENYLYQCGEVSSVSFTPPSSGIAEVIFTSGSTAATLTLPNTVLVPDGFDPSSLDTNTVYEISVLNGTYASVASWPVSA